MSSLQTSADLISAALDQADEATDGTSEFASRAVDWLNWAYRAVWMGGNEFLPQANPDWWWLRATGILTLNPVYSTGTVSVTQGSASVTLSAISSGSLAGYHFKTDADADVYIISAHTAGTNAITLDSVFTGTTASAGSYQAMQRDYALASDVIELIAPMRTARVPYRISGMTVDALAAEWPDTGWYTGSPSSFALLSESAVRFSHGGDPDGISPIRVTYDYLAKPTDLANDSAEPAMPLQYRYILADMVEFRLHMSKENTTRMQGISQKVKSALMAMWNENMAKTHRTGDQGRIFSRGRDTGARRFPLRTESGHIIG